MTRTNAVVIRVLTLSLFIAAALGVAWLYKKDALNNIQSTPHTPSKQEVADQMKSLPLVFQKNAGQVDHTVLYFVRNGSTSVFLRPPRLRTSLHKRLRSMKKPANRTRQRLLKRWP